MGDDPARPWAGQDVQEPDEWLLQTEPHRVAVSGLDAIDRVEQIAVRVPFLAEETIERELDVFGRQLAPVHGRCVMPAHAFTQVEDIRQIVQLRPALGKVGLDGEDARRHAGARLEPNEFVVDEAQGGTHLEVQGEMRIEVGRIVATYAQYPAALGLSLRPERARRQKRFRGKGGSDRQARPENVTTGHPGYAARLTSRPLHDRPPPPRPKRRTAIRGRFSSSWAAPHRRSGSAHSP